jgi:competence protein ComEA
VLVVLVVLGRLAWSGRTPDGTLVVPPAAPSSSSDSSASDTSAATSPPSLSAPSSGRVASLGSPSGSASGSASGGSGPGDAGATRVLVHVVGAVKGPGVVALAGGSRVLDAVSAAGGASRKADLSLLNLARPVVDGEQIRVPAHGETTAAAVEGGVGGAPTPAPGKLNLNTADESALDTLPGVGPVLAGRIVQWRSENGRFTSVDELAEVTGIGDHVLEGLRELVTV